MTGFRKIEGAAPSGAIIGALAPGTTTIGWLGLEEVITPPQIAGSALALVGVVVISLRPAKQA